MLEKHSEKCIETEDGFPFGEQEFCENIIKSNCIILGEDMNLCSIDIKSTDNLKKIISAFDKVLCSVKDKTIDVVYDDIDVSGSCITKELVIDPVSGRKNIKLGIDALCITTVVNIGNQGITPVPFIIYSSKYSICGNQSTVLTSNYVDTVWYNQLGIVVGNGISLPITEGGNYYATRLGKVSNIVNIIYTSICDVFSYTKIKNFYKECPLGTTPMAYTYSKIYTSDISYQDALSKSELDSISFDSEGQTVVNSTGTCIGESIPIDNSCFNVFLSNPSCNIVTPITVPTTPISPVSPVSPISPVAPSPISSCELSFAVTDIICTTSVPTSPVPTGLEPINVFLLAGESNAGTRNEFSTLASGEAGFRQGVRILNNNTNQLEQLNVGVNNYFGESAAINNGWGWEVQLANLRANGTIDRDFIIVKTAQGGAFIGQYNTDIPNGYYSTLTSRVNALKAILQAEGKIPVFYVLYSQGINNALYPGLDDQGHFPGLTGIDYWQTATTAHLANLRSVLGSSTKISLMKFFEPYGSYLNNAIQNIVNANSNNSFISTGDLTLQADGLHFGASGSRTIVDRYISTIGFSVIAPVNTPVTPIVSTSSFNNILKTLPVETESGVYSPLPFANVSVALKPYEGNRQFPKYPVIWHATLTNFINDNRKVWDLGISFPVDLTPGFGGDGVLCVDYIRYLDANTGQLYPNGIDPACNISINDFVSQRPFYRRVKGEGGTAINNNETFEQLYDIGTTYTISSQFGYGDDEGIKHNTGFTVTDVENGEHGRLEEVPIVIGMANTAIGHVTSMYNQSINIVYPDLSHYPLDYVNGGYRALKVKLDGTLAYDGNGNTIQNSVINDAWKPETKITIASRNIINKGAIDYENIKESSEVSCYSSAAYFHGELINYDGVNTRVTNKFGLNRNAEHIVAHTIYGTQVRKWHLRKYFNDREFYTLGKTLCDRGNIGLTSFNQGSSFVTNPALSAKHLPRKLAFIKTMFMPFMGSYFHHWDRNTENNIDGVNGDLFAINLINQKKTLSQGNLSFVDLFDDYDFKLWTAEISYDGGLTWKQEKGTDYIMSPTSIPHGQCVTATGVWAVFLARPENTENLSCKLRINFNGSYRYLDVTSSMWETTNYNFRNTALSDIPNAHKDYYYNLIDLNSTVVPTTVPSPVTPVSSPVSTPVTVPSPVSAPTVSTTGTVIVEPNKPVYYFSDGKAPSYYSDVTHSPLPAMYASQTHSGSIPPGTLVSSYITMAAPYDAVEDIVYLKNNQVEFGINLKRGGHVAIARRAGETFNYIYNGYDGGFQVGLDAYQKPDGYTQQGEVSGSGIGTIFSYNVTHGGDFRNDSVSLLDYHSITDGYYVKLRPIHYPLSGKHSETYIEAWYTLQGRALKCEYKYTSFRTDNQQQSGTVGWGIPACFLNSNLTRYKSYVGDSPFTNAPTIDGLIPTSGGCAIPETARTKEFWGMAYNPNTNIGFGVFNQGEGGDSVDIIFKQCEVYSGNPPGTEFAGGFTFIQPNITLNLSSANFIKYSTAYITVGDENQIRSTFNNISQL